MKMLRKFAAVGALLVGSTFALAQGTTTITGTITDSDSINWAGAIVTVTLNNPGGGQPMSCNQPGVRIPVQQTFTLDSSGAVPGGTTIQPNSCIIPAGTKWQFTIASNTSAPAAVIPPTTVSGSSYNLGTFANPLIPAPRFMALYNSRGYSVIEASLPMEANAMQLVTTGHVWTYHDGAWQDLGPGGGGGGACGPVSGDPTSTDCGTGNNVGAAYSGPPNDIQTYGQNNGVGVQGGTDAVMIGNQTGQNAGHVENTTAVGLFDYNNQTGTNNTDVEGVYVGYANAYIFNTGGNAIHCNDCTAVGNRNMQDSTGNGSTYSYTNVAAYGFQNAEHFNINIAIGTHRDVVAVGDATVDDLHQVQDVIGIGDGALSGGNNNPGPTYTDVIAIGDVAASLPPDGSSTLIAIGLCPMCIGDHGTGITGGLAESIALGDGAMNAAENTHDLIAIGDEAMKGPHGANTYQTGNDNIAIGLDAGAAYRAGSENIGIGTNACAVNYGSGDGDSTTDGNENICIGDSAGQSVTTPLDNIIAIGHNAQATEANSTTIGNSSTLGVKIWQQTFALAMPTGNISANTCSSTTVQAAHMVNSTTTFKTGFATDPTGVVGWGANGGLVLQLWPDATPANGFDWAVCNQSTSTVNAGAITINVKLEN